MKKQNSHIIVVSLLFLLAVVVVASCKKYVDPAQIFEEAVPKPYTKQRKVMLISIDGASGPEIQKIMPTNIAGLLEHSKYSWEAFADARTKDGPSWVNLLTGTSASKLAIVDSTLQAVEHEEEGEHDEVPRYSTLLQRLLEGGVEYTSVAVSPWTDLVREGFGFANHAIEVADDEAVKDTIIARMAMSKLGTVVVNFNGVNKAGLNSAFSADQQEYRDAVTKVDGYIGEIMTALKSRSTYDREDWLVIITSNHGGAGDSYGEASFEERKVLALYYNESFDEQEFTLPSIINTVNVTKKSPLPTLPATQATNYNFGTTGDFTVMFKIMFKSKPGTTSHGTVLSKSSNSYGNGLSGWNFQVEGANTGKYRVVLGGGSGTVLVYIPGAASEPINTWVTLALKVYEQGGKRLASLYTNGVPGAVVDVTGINFSSNNNLSIGASNNSIGTPSVIINNLGIWNTAVSDEYMANYVCQREMDGSDPYYSNLIGYWPCDEGSGNTFHNRSPLATGKDLTFTEYTWNVINSWECGEPDPRSQFIQNSDVAAQIFYWMQIKTADSWGLDGTVWLRRYEPEFVK